VDQRIEGEDIHEDHLLKAFEMSRGEDYQIEHVLGNEDHAEMTGLGALFRRERERKGLTLAQVFDMTRLRPAILEALEKEDWEELPSAVFVRGFIRSYAHALNLDEDQVLELYDRTSPLTPAPPRPLLEPVHAGKRRFLTFLFILVCAALAFFLWNLYFPTAWNPLKKGVRTSHVEKPALNTAPLAAKSELTTVTEAKVKEPEPPRHTGTDATFADESPALEEKMTAASAPPPVAEAEPLPPETPAVETSPQPEIVPPAEDEGDKLTLKAHVKKNTWVKIVVDGGEPKEYIFKPGSEPEWKADKSFDLLIGNAGGLDLEFNGRKIENLGQVGQVVRLRLPREQ
jgi:cytoskeleton protein RodZ